LFQTSGSGPPAITQQEASRLDFAIADLEPFAHRAGWNLQTVGPVFFRRERLPGKDVIGRFRNAITAEIRALSFSDVFFARHTLSRSAGGIGAQMQTVDTPQDTRLRVAREFNNAKIAIIFRCYGASTT
jgi:hypothetical protein